MQMQEFAPKNVMCPNCKDEVAYEPALAGSTGLCPNCREKIEMPVTHFSLLLDIRSHAYRTQLILGFVLIAIALHVIHQW